MVPVPFFIYDYITLDKKSITKKVVTEIFNKDQIIESFPKKWNLYLLEKLRYLIFL